MASLFLVNGNRFDIHKLEKPIFSIGREQGNDIISSKLDTEVLANIFMKEGRHFFKMTDNNKYVLHNTRSEREFEIRNGDVVDLAKDLRFIYFKNLECHESEGQKSRAVEYYLRFYDYSRRLLSFREGESDILVDLLDMCLEISETSKGFFVTVGDDEGDEFDVMAARNLERKNVRESLESISRSTLMRVVRERKPVVIMDAKKSSPDDESVRSLIGKSMMNLDLSTIACFPVEVRGRVRGILFLCSKLPAGHLGTRDIELINMIIRQASVNLRGIFDLMVLRKKNEELEEQMKSRRDGDSFVGGSKPVQKILHMIEKVAPADLTVLLVGETGTGKELLAQEIHKRSGRNARAFVPVNCSAIPENLLESVLFGHKKGSFTGATCDQAGKFTVAHGGTIFLDEISEMPLHLQAKLLRVLQEGQVERVGDAMPGKVDVRVVAASNRDLKHMVGEGTFREDLYFRLNEITLDVPPLRERGMDVVMLARYFAVQMGKKMGRTFGFSDEALSKLVSYRWPGNVRELQNVVKRAVVFCEEDEIDIDNIQIDYSYGAGATSTALGGGESFSLPLIGDKVIPMQDAVKQFQMAYFNKILSMNEGNRTRTARDLGITPRSVFRYLRAEQ